MTRPDEDERTLWDALVQRKLRLLPPAATLSPGQLERIERRLGDASPVRARSRLPWIVATSAALALSVALLFLAYRSAPVAGALIVPAGAVAQLGAPAPVRLVVVGPATMTDSDGVVPRLRDGRIAARSGDTPVELDVPEGRVTIAGHSTVVVEVYGGRTRVAAYVGRASVAWQQFSSPITVAAGTALSTTGVATTSASEARQIDSLLEPPPAPTTAAPTTSPTVPARAPTPTPASIAVTPGRRPRPAPAPPVGAAIAEPKTTAPSEVEIVSSAVRQLHDGQPAAALQTIDDYWLRHPGGELAPEGETVAVEALLRLGRRADALTRLDAMALGDRDDAERLLVVRGELRAERGRCSEAVGDFTGAQRTDDATVRARAFYGRGVCRARLGDVSGARDDYEASLRVEPNGRSAGAARRALGIP